MTVAFTGEVHPVADLFPMLADDELAQLAEDIKARGLLQPIVLDGEGRLLDGRNRLAACDLAGVTPTFATHGGDDPDGYALAVNMARRNLSKGQMALVATKSVETTEFGSGTRLSGLLGVSEGLLSHARTVWKHAPDLGEQVIAGAAHLDEAYAIALENKRRAVIREQKMARISAADPDLAVLVREKRQSVDDAIAVLDAREQKARQEAEDRRSEEERLRRINEQEREESLERHRERIRMVVTGWPTVRDIVRPDPDGPQATEITNGLGESDQLALKRLLADLMTE